MIIQKCSWFSRSHTALRSNPVFTYVAAVSVLSFVSTCSLTPTARSAHVQEQTPSGKRRHTSLARCPGSRCRWRFLIRLRCQTSHGAPNKRLNTPFSTIMEMEGGRDTGTAALEIGLAALGVAPGRTLPCVIAYVVAGGVVHMPVWLCSGLITVVGECRHAVSQLHSKEAKFFSKVPFSAA